MQNGHHHHNNNNGFIGGGYVVPYYGYYDSGSYAADQSDYQSNDQANDQYNGGPTIFDRRGSGIAPAPAPTPRAAREREEDQPPAPRNEEVAAQPEPAPAPEPEQTVLVFKDGHQVEVGNYAIVGNTLFDLTGGRRRKIAIADLDLTATTKQNDDRGIDFQVPAAPEAN
jgi:hypothetical protein